MKNMYASSFLAVGLASLGVCANPQYRRQASGSASAPLASATGVWAAAPSVKCSAEQLETINQAMDDAQQIVNFAAERMSLSPTSLPYLNDLMFGNNGDPWVKLIYSTKMFPDGFKDLSWRMSKSNVKTSFSCNDNVPGVCDNAKGYYLTSEWKKKGSGDDSAKGGSRTINFCKRWFNENDADKNFRNLDDIVTDCKSASPKHCASMQDLEFGRAQTLIHMLKFDNVPKTRGEYAWGVDQAEQLADGQLDIPSYRANDVTGQPLCIDSKTGKAGKCDEQLAYSDAATWAYIGVAQYINDKIGKELPLKPKSD